MKRQLGIQRKIMGCSVILTVMLIDRYLFPLQDGFILAMAVISALMLISGIWIVRREDKDYFS